MRNLIVILMCACAFGQELRRPTVDANRSPVGCSGGNVISAAMPQAYDSAGQSTSSTISVGALVSCTQFGCNTSTAASAREFKTWQAPSFTYSGLTLNINSLSVGWIHTNGIGGNACLAYSVNNGGTWTSIRCDTSGNGWTQTTDNITLTPTQDLSMVKVTACAEGRGGGAGTPPQVGADGITIYDIWTSGSGAGQGPGNGSGTGARHNAVVVN